MIKDLVPVGIKAVKLAKPPPHDADPKVVMAWRWFMAIGVVMNATALTVHILLACGLTPFFGGFAYASEVSGNATAVRNQTLEILEQRMWDIQTRKCVASNPESRELYSRKIVELQDRYYEIKKRYYNLPDCKELL